MSKYYRSLHALRGLMALLIVVYHFTTWLDLGNYSVFMRFYGRYGVSIFYLLSGFTMSLIYSGRLNKYEKARTFLIKRFKRIYPLLFFTSTLTFLGLKFNGAYIEWKDLAQSIFLVFPFFKWWSPIVRGAWSIGNEVIFYLVFAFLQYIANNRFTTLFFVILIMSFGFSYLSIDPNLALTDKNWINYTNPLSQIKFFIIGVFAQKVHNSDKSFVFSLLSKYRWILIISGFLFSYITVGNDNIVSSYTGGIGFIVSLLIFAGFIHDGKKSNRYLHHLGTISYSVYLTHPLVFSLYRKLAQITHFTVLPDVELFFLITFTILTSHFSYRHIEDRFR